jgi:hypothetical protein
MIDEWQATFSTRLQIDRANKKMVHMMRFKCALMPNGHLSCTIHDFDNTSLKWGRCIFVTRRFPAPSSHSGC